MPKPEPPLTSSLTEKDYNRMGYKGKLVGHGFRALASTTLNEKSNFSKDAIEVQLSHMDEDKIRGTYNRAEYAEERAKMMQWWGNYIDAAASNDGTNIIPLRQSNPA